MKDAFAWYTLADRFERDLYKRIRSAIRSRQLVFIEEDTPECVNRVFQAVLTDGPELFCVDGKWRLVLQDGSRYAQLHFTFTPKETEKGRYQLAQLADSFSYLKDIPASERILAVYDWLLAHVEYGFTETDGQSSYDALVRRRAVCKEISKAFQYLMRSLDVFCTLQEGSLDGVGRHIWNIVEIGGAFYHVDVCMGYMRFAGVFGAEGNDRRCCLVGDDTIRKTHYLTQPEDTRFVSAYDYGREETCV